METNEIMTNNGEVIEATEEIINENSGKGFKIAIGVGLAALVGGIAYKRIVKPIARKIKAKKGYGTVEIVDQPASVNDSEESDEDEN